MLQWAVTGQLVPWKPLGFAPRRIILGQQTVIRLCPHLGEFDQVALFRKRLREEINIFTWLEKSACSRYDAVVDIGANVGLYSLFLDALSRRSPGPRLEHIYAFEPSLAAYRRLLDNVAANGCSSVSPFGVGVSDRSGLLQFFQPEGRLVNGSLSLSFAELFPEVVRESTVPVLAGARLEPLFARHPRVLLKVDAEGAEPQILSSMAAILDRYGPDLIVEVLADADQALSGLECLQGYACFQFGPDGPVRRTALTSDPERRDWLLTKRPQEIDGSSH